jgi:hypothetical protein
MSTTPIEWTDRTWRAIAVPGLTIHCLLLFFSAQFRIREFPNAVLQSESQNSSHEGRPDTSASLTR